MEETSTAIVSSKARSNFGVTPGVGIDEQECEALRKFAEELNCYDRLSQLKIVRSAFAESSDGLGYVNFHFIIEDNEAKVSKLRITH
jgi:hypothetical protein